MTTARIHKHIDSETIVSPELRETHESFFGLAPPEPTPEEHDRNMMLLREKAEADPFAAAWLKAIESDALDVERIILNRGMQ